MRRLKSRIRRVLHDERGSNAVLIAFLLVPMLGFGAMALDVSAQHAEHAQLQHGADAAALAVASSCARDETACTTTADVDAQEYVNGNAAIPVEGTADVTIDKANRTAQVTAEATFPHFFASLIDSDDDPSSTTVRSTAVAEWGSPESGETIPLAIAECELTRHFDPGTEEQGDPFILLLIGPGKGDKKPDECAPGYPGGFGWLEGDDIDGDGDADCKVAVEVGVPEPGVPGKSDTKAGGCPDDYITKLIGTTVLIPIYDSFTEGSSGSHGSYNVKEFAAFYITGYHIASAKCEPPGAKSGSDCYLPGESKAPGFKGGEFGLQGYFKRYVAIGEDFDLGEVTPNGGLKVAKLIG
ncbi:Flp pilus assembly protein TadG [Agromyces cerinus]|uniref:Tad domain-containing protein n=1 Tax=Agromyces cerinus TaxID=33878 RepID=UPI001959BBFA|nr:Tad domain-containing protein [Agromyces cerinus]MBM7831990.1 Flp pilus assembly protein TadG [Agromyces cerinus]